jgi:hypothetical protein
MLSLQKDDVCMGLEWGYGILNTQILRREKKKG